jgi:molybdenum-dependent DNA-binding transcriptional regulator ModE
MLAATWTVIAIMSTFMVAYFVDSRQGRRELRRELTEQLDQVESRLIARMDKMDSHIDQVEFRLDARLNAIQEQLSQHLEMHAHS